MNLFLHKFCRLQKKTLGQSVFDYVLRKLDLLERDYFGLQYEDEQKSMVNERYVCNIHVFMCYVCVDVRIIMQGSHLTWVE